MAIRRMLSNLCHVLRSMLHLLARPVRGDAGRAGVVIQPYRGYGMRDEVLLMGRVFRQPRSSGAHAGTLGRDLIDLARRILRRGISGAVVDARIGGDVQRVTTDRDGYFCARLKLSQLLPADRLWHPMHLKLISNPAGTGDVAEAIGEVYVPPRTSRFVVISDIDDTIMYTGVSNKVLMLWRLFAQGVHDRLPFAGVAAFHRALHFGISGSELNVLLYVSRGPWSIYDILEKFFEIHDIPVGPILFLREWGIRLRHPFPRRSKNHKLDSIRDILTLYRELPFVLIGDSGQHDPEIYSQIVQEHPGRVLAVYIRNVSRKTSRHRAIELLAGKVADAGSTLLLTADSFAMAEHAAGHQLISQDALGEVMAERQEQDGDAAVKPARIVRGPHPQETRQAVEHGELRHVLEETDEQDVPPSVVVEPENDRHDQALRQRDQRRP